MEGAVSRGPIRPRPTSSQAEYPTICRSFRTELRHKLSLVCYRHVNFRSLRLMMLFSLSPGWSRAYVTEYASVTSSIGVSIFEATQVIVIPSQSCIDPRVIDGIKIGLHSALAHARFRKARGLVTQMKTRVRSRIERQSRQRIGSQQFRARASSNCDTQRERKDKPGDECSTPHGLPPAASVSRTCIIVRTDSVFGSSGGVTCKDVLREHSQIRLPPNYLCLSLQIPHRSLGAP